MSISLLDNEVAPYAINVPESTVNDLRTRLENTRWSQGPDLGWAGGMDANYLRELRLLRNDTTGATQSRA